MDVTVKVNIDERRFKRKPTRPEIGAIINRMTTPKDLTVRKLAELLGSGCSCRPGAIRGTKAVGFISQQVILIDFDNDEAEKITPGAAVARAKQAGLSPCFGYETHRSTAEQVRFRLAFCLNRPITDRVQRDRAYNCLYTVFLGVACDDCSDTARIFLGGHTGLIYEDFGAMVDAEKLLAMPFDEETDAKQAEKRKTDAEGTSQKRQGNAGRKAGGIPDASEAVQAIKARDAEGLKKVLNRKPKVFRGSQKFFWYLYREIDFAELLGVKPGENFSCLFHDDENPSANVFRTGEGVWKYHCFGCGETLNLKQFVEKLGGFTSEAEALEFIRVAFNLDIRLTDWAQGQRTNIENIVSCLQRTDENGFVNLCPIAAHNTRHAVSFYLCVLKIAEGTLSPDRIDRKDGSGQIVFGLSARQLAGEAGKKSPGKANCYLKMLVYHGLLRIVPDEEVPLKLLQMAWAEQRKGKGDGKRNRVTFYSVPDWNEATLKEVEAAGERWKRNGYRLASISYEGFLRTEGPEVATHLYPTSQVKRKDGTMLIQGTSKESDAKHDELRQIISDLINSQGYCTEAQVVELASNSRALNDLQLKRSLTDICNEGGLTRCRATNKLKERFGIPGDRYSHPYIIFGEED